MSLVSLNPPNERKLALIGLLIRIVLFYLPTEGLRDSVSKSFTITTAFDSNLHVKEFLYLKRNKNNDSVITNASRVSPITGVIFGVFYGDNGSRSACFVIDLVTALMLRALHLRLVRGKNVHENEENVSVFGFYLVHPMILMSLLSHSQRCVEFLSIVMVFYVALDEGKRAEMMTGVALAALTLIYAPAAIAMFPGVLAHFLCNGESKNDSSNDSSSLLVSGRKRGVQFVMQYFFALATLVNVADRYVVPNDSLRTWLRIAIFDRFTGKELQPNVGLQWYVYSLVWKRFLSWYYVAFQGCSIACTIALAIRFSSSSPASSSPSSKTAKNREAQRVAPLFSSCVALFSTIALSSHPSLGEFAFVSLLCLAFANVSLTSKNAQKIVLDGAMIAIAIFGLSFVTLRAWLETRTGNPNYFFAVTLMFALGQVYIVYHAINFALLALKKKES